MNYDYSSIVDKLLDWYDQNRRSLPWRDNPQPYYVWISEIMLQQTRVEAVKGYFTRFIEELPTVIALAQATEDQLLKLWEGLGYYNRVRNMQKAAIIVVEQFDGQLPSKFEELIQLPGIGSYTAGAIASIAFGEKVPAVDGNVLRITKRLAAEYDDITKAKTVKQVQEALKNCMPKRSGDFNQALMDLGATICLPNGAPLCDKCPLAELCIAKRKDVAIELPVKPSKKPRKQEDKTVLVIQYDDKYAIHKRPSKGLLAKMWEIPNIDRKLMVEEVEELLEEKNAKVEEIELLGKSKHIFSHIEWHMIGYYVKLSKMFCDENPGLQLEESNLQLYPGEYNWVTKEELEERFALPTAFHAYKYWEKN